METRTVEQVEGWKSRPFSDGYAGLRELSDGEFSGAVRTGGAWLFMLNGRTIGIHEGSLDDFEDAQGTAYAAPHPSLPLLFSMQAEGGETRAKYYTNDTPLSEADSTLTDGGFTGYVELSENVLSGDYYVAYYGGRSMSVAFVGASEQVLSGEEAFERAADEVGIYEVRDVDLEVIEIPEPEAPEPSPGPAAGDSGPATDTDSSDSNASDAGVTDSGPTESEPSEPGSSESESPESESPDEPGTTSPPNDATEPDSTAGRPTGASARDATDPTESGVPGVAEAETADAESAPEEVEEPEPRSAEPRSAETRPSSPETDASANAGRNATAEMASESVSEPSQAAESVTDPDTVPKRQESESEQATDDEGMFSEEAEWREATTIPSLDPDRTESDDDAAGAARRSKQQRTQSAATEESANRRSQTKSSGRSEAGGQSQTSSQSTDRTAERSATASASSSEAAAEANARVEELQSELRQREQQVEKLETHLSKVQSQRNELKRERDALRQEVERLEAALESVESDAAGGNGRQLGRDQAFDETNLFVRYRSKGDATLDEAARGDAEADDVNDNLRLEHHTQFEADDVAVDGRPFEEFLSESFEYRFASWVVRELLYEVRDTGHRGRLRGLYDAIPKIDRVDLHGSVNASADDDDTRQVSFDVIMRDRMGNPLVVADLNESRDPTTGEMMGELVDSASGVSQAHDDLVGAFQVTESFFAPEALETTENATSGGLLSREKRASFVKLSRKRGFHLCLVESRSGGFHLNVPEL